MKFDEMEKVELESYPKNNVIYEQGQKRARKQFGLKINAKQGLNFAVGASILGAAIAVVTLGTSMVGMAMNGVLGSVFKAMISL